MKIAVVAANGRVAQKVVKEALDRGFEVKAFGRGAENKTAASDYVQIWLALMQWWTALAHGKRISWTVM